MDAFNSNVNQANTTIDEKLQTFNETLERDGFTSAYRTITQNGITKKMLRINATTIKHGQTIALYLKNSSKT